MNTKSKKGIIGITFVAIMIASIFAVVAPTAVAKWNPDPPLGYYPNSTIKIYGDVQPKGNAPERYSDWRQPFDPTVIPKDSIVFNPAMIGKECVNNASTVFLSMSAHHVDDTSEDINEKMYLRAWYEPCGKYWGPRKNHTYPTINLEYTYMLIDSQDMLPCHGDKNGTKFAFPICEIANQTGLGAFENVLAGNSIAALPYRVKLVTVSGGPVGNYNKSVNGTIAIEKKYYLDPGDSVQFLDHKLQYIGTGYGGNPGIFRVWYAGNMEDDSAVVVQLPSSGLLHGLEGNPQFFSRHNSMRTSFNRNYPWYANFEFKEQSTHQAAVDVGRFLWNCSVFYVNGVRYDVPAIEVLDTDGNGTNGPEEFKYITLRTKLPKCTDEVMDESRVSTQDIDCIEVNETLPFLPPFSTNHTIVDDIDIPLWAPLKLVNQWPEGNPDGPLGSEYFPGAEAFLTMQYPPDEWQDYFKAVPIEGRFTVSVSDYQQWDGPYYPDNNLPPYWLLDECGKKLLAPAPGSYKVFDPTEWIAYKVEDRLIPADPAVGPEVEPLMVYYIAETEEQRLSTNLLEKLNETGIGTSALYENWTKFDIQTLPDQYTEFALPAIPDLNVSNYVGGDEQNSTYWMLHGDYLITTSLISNNSAQRPGGKFTDDRVAFAYDMVDGEDGTDLYVNADVNKTNPADLSQNVRVRIYGDVGVTTAPRVYTNWEQPFNPTVIRKDSITFDPAKLLWDATDFPMYAQNKNAEIKQYLRAWYEPCYQYSKKKKPSVVTETTYMLLDRQDELPMGGDADRTRFAFPIAANTSTTQIGLELFENVISDPSMAARPNLVRLTHVSSPEDPIGAYNKTVNGTIRIEKKYYIDNLHNQTIQFLDHTLEFYGTDGNGTIGIVRICYAGNKPPLDCEEVHLNMSQRTYFDRHNNMYDTPLHGGLDTHTWYAHFEFKTQSTHLGAIDVGKELQTGDIFYVDSVRYEVPAMEVYDHNGDGNASKFKYITLRTPFPKDLTNSAFCTKKIDDGDEVSSQWITMIPPCHPIPVLPPLNWTQTHTIVDDTDVVLWNPLKHLHKWPVGDPNGPLGSEYFPCGERYLTMQYPPAQWQRYFCAAPIDTDKDMSPLMPTDHQQWDGPYYPDDNVPSNWTLCKCGKVLPSPSPTSWTTFDNEHWIANDVNERMISGVEPLTFCWKNESKDPRYSTNLLQILNETNIGYANMTENWTKFDIQTLPDLYTEFKLPVIPSLNISCYVGGDWQDYFNPQINSHPGSYLITTSFYAPNAEGDLNPNQTYQQGQDNRYAFTFNASHGEGIYMNEDPPAEIGEGTPTIELKAGKNYVSLPTIPDDASPATVFPGCEVWAYDTSTNGMVPPAVFGDLECGRGYLVRSSEDRTVEINGTGCAVRDWDTIVGSLTGTWNLIGPGGSDVTIEDSDLLIVGWNGNSWDVLSAGATLENTRGYWIYTGL